MAANYDTSFYLRPQPMAAPQDPLEQESKMLTLQGAIAQRAAQAQSLQREQAYRGELAGLGPNPTEEALLGAATRHGSASDLLRTLTASRDRRSALDVATQNRQAQIEASLTATRERIAADLQRARERGADQTALQQMMIDGRREIAEIAAGGRAPSISSIVDPKDPSRMISIDTRVYRPGGSLGDPGVIGVAGKEPATAKREEKEGQGKELLRAELDNLREHYRVLNDARAIPSSDRGFGSNAVSWLQGSTAGQVAGRVAGTKEQDARNQIQSARLRIMNAIKNATGMSAQQLNSNVELKTWLDSMTSLNGSYESNVGIIDAIDKAFLKGGAKGPTKITSDDEYNALPSGTEFIGPDGKKRRKP